jgi:hypothetical protein
MEDFEFKRVLLDIISLLVVFIGGISTGIGFFAGTSFIIIGICSWVIALFINYISYKRVGGCENV